jgi:hypothetical protein
MNIFEVINKLTPEQINNSKDDPILLVEGKPGYTTRIDIDGNITMIKATCDYDPNGKCTIE